MSKSKIILVTGASSGIGRNCAEFLASKGFVVYGTSRNIGNLDAQSIGFEALELDVTSESSVSNAIKTIVEAHGRIDVLVNNAGYALMGSVEESSEAQVTAAFQTNVIGVQRLLRHVLPIMRAQKSGWIISISSIGANFGLPFRSVYSSTKAALGNLMEGLQYEVEEFGIHVSVIEPGDVKTAINEHRQRAASGDYSPYKNAYQQAEKHINDTVTEGMNPEVVSRRVYEAISTETPSFRYIVGSATQKLSISASNVLPKHVFRRLVRKYMNLK